ncbi:TetR/AcrR family transcriptional regulator [Naasia aerilata]|uniref:TetR family transcriptional regulator n=1 Tax=Naasia aerilata TaxID=1162966 RepID=A0ABN6XKS7_9MICO|nr:TetR/AcrR family transcriptional regulator [Naasia aerilata]BDZ45544.1 TetR family transcriptional regulator [Naasia aerilata]
MVEDDAPQRRGPRGPYAKSSQTRTAILDAALKVFAESGYRSGSLRTVADRVGMSEAGLLHHFPSKSALLAAVLERRDEQAEERYDLDGSGGVEVLRSLLRIAERNAAAPGVVELFCTLSAESTSPEHPAHEYFVARYRRSTRTVQTAFEAVAASGELRPGVEPAAAARGTVALMDGLQLQWLLDRDAVDMAADLRTFFRTLVTAEL